MFFGIFALYFVIFLYYSKITGFIYHQNMLQNYLKITKTAGHHKFRLFSVH